MRFIGESMFRLLVSYTIVIFLLIMILPEPSLPEFCKGTRASACCFLSRTEVESPTGLKVAKISEGSQGVHSSCKFVPAEPNHEKSSTLVWFGRKSTDIKTNGSYLSVAAVQEHGIPGALAIDGIDAQAYWLENKKNGGELYVLFEPLLGINLAFKIVAPSGYGLPPWGPEREMARWVIRRFLWTIEKNPAIENSL